MSVKVLVFEFDQASADKLVSDLRIEQYVNLRVVLRSEEAIDRFIDFQPDLIISETHHHHQNYIESIKHIQQIKPVPVIYLTEKIDALTVKKLVASRPILYLEKPHNPKELTINIQLAIHNFNRAHPRLLNQNESIFIFDNNVYQRIQKSEILYVEADGAYVKIITLNKKYQLTANLKTFISQFNHPDFFRVSRKHFVNMPHITKMDKDILLLRVSTNREISIPLGRAQRQEMMQRFDFLKTKV